MMFVVYMILLHLPALCFHQSVQAYIPAGYLGCFKDNRTRILQGNWTYIVHNSGDKCKAFCKSDKYRYAGTEFMSECYCGNQIRKQVLSEGCNTRCPGSTEEYCGGSWHITVYDTWPCATNPCKHDGECEDISAHNYICNCTDRWTGNNCEIGFADDSNKSLLAVYILVPIFAIVVGSVIAIVFCKRGNRNKNEDSEVIIHECDLVQRVSENSIGIEHGLIENTSPPKKQQDKDHELNGAVTDTYNEINHNKVMTDAEYNVLSSLHTETARSEMTYDHVNLQTYSSVDKSYSYLSGSTSHIAQAASFSTYSHICNENYGVKDNKNVNITYSKLGNYIYNDVDLRQTQRSEVGDYSHTNDVKANITATQYKTFNSATNFLNTENEYAVIK